MLRLTHRHQTPVEQKKISTPNEKVKIILIRLYNLFKSKALTVVKI